jgi:hypothetical protein
MRPQFASDAAPERTIATATTLDNRMFTPPSIRPLAGSGHDVANLRGRPKTAAMLDNAFKGLLVALGFALVIWAGVAAVRGAKRGSRFGVAMLSVFLAVFGSDAPPPHQATEEARQSKDRNRAGDPGGDDD